MIHVYTGNGKGKTTAGIGQALRAAGHGYKAEIIQFAKAERGGEYNIIKKVFKGKKIDINQFGSGKYLIPGNIDNKDIEKAEAGMKYAEKALKSKQTKVIVLDEINVVLHYGLLKIDTVKKILSKYRKIKEIILTGQSCPDGIIKIADYVTEMKEVKHPFKKGIKARRGIEY